MYDIAGIAGALGGAGGAGGALGAIGAAAPLVSVGLGLAQGVYGAIKKGKAEREMQKLLAERKAYQTPEEVFMQLQATQQKAGQGMGADVLNYLTTGANRDFSSGVGAATRLGGNANDLAALFDKRIMASMGIAGQNQAQKMANFSQYLGALGTMAENRTAEWQSQENILKDRIQAVSGQGADATRNIQGGLNTVLGGVSAAGMSNLYNQDLNMRQQQLNQGLLGAAGVDYITPRQMAAPDLLRTAFQGLTPPTQLTAPALLPPQNSNVAWGLDNIDQGLVPRGVATRPRRN